MAVPQQARWQARQLGREQVPAAEDVERQLLGACPCKAGGLRLFVIHFGHEQELSPVAG